LTGPQGSANGSGGRSEWSIVWPRGSGAYNASWRERTNSEPTVHDAARRPGTSEVAVRVRIKRGTLKADKEAGRLYVLLDVEPTAQPTAEPQAELVEKLRDRVRYLQGVVDTGEEREGAMSEGPDRSSGTRGFPISERSSWWRRMLGAPERTNRLF
jgi:hypothetical protein